MKAATCSLNRFVYRKQFHREKNVRAKDKSTTKHYVHPFSAVLGSPYTVVLAVADSRKFFLYSENIPALWRIDPSQQLVEEEVLLPVVF